MPKRSKSKIKERTQLQTEVRGQHPNTPGEKHSKRRLDSTDMGNQPKGLHRKQLSHDVSSSHKRKRQREEVEPRTLFSPESGSNEANWKNTGVKRSQKEHRLLKNFSSSFKQHGRKHSGIDYLNTEFLRTSLCSDHKEIKHINEVHPFRGKRLAYSTSSILLSYLSVA